MHRGIPKPSLLLFLLFLAFTFLQCRHDSTPAISPDQVKPSQPGTQPLKLSDPKKLSWVEVKGANVNPPKRRLDIASLPSTPYEGSGFKPFPRPPSEAHFDFASLPDSAFDLEKIPSIPLQFRTSFLPPPVVVKSGPLLLNEGSPIAVAQLASPQGLPDKIIISLFKDRNGFIWIGTDRGLYRYDGVYMYCYSKSFSKVIVSIIEDNESRIWFTTDNSLEMIDLQKGTHSISGKINSSNNDTPKMILDSNGQIWIPSVTHKTVSIINTSNQTFKSVNQKTGLRGGFAFGVTEDLKKNIWITTYAGAFILNASDKKIHYLNTNHGLESDSLQAISMDRQGRILMAFRNGGFSLVNSEKGIIKNFGGAHMRVTFRIIEDKRDKIWMSANNGLWVADIESGTYKHFTLKEGLTESFALDILEDDHEKLWVGSLTGIQIISQYGEIVHPVEPISVSTILTDKNGKLWVGYGSNGGIRILDEGSRKMWKLDEHNSLGDPFIQYLAEINDKVWISTNGGLDIIDPLQKNIQHFGTKEGLTDNNLYNFLMDSQNRLWMTGSNMGVNLIDFTNQKIYRTDTIQGVSDKNNSDVKLDKKGKIWLASNKKGVDIIDIENNTIQNLSDAPGLRDTCNRLLMLDDRDRMWIGTDKGIYVADTKENTLTAITTKEGLNSNKILSLQLYHGKVLVEAGNKVNIISVPADAAGKWKISTMDGSDQLSKNANSWNSNLITTNGQFLWGDVGLTVIRNIREEEDSARTFVTGLKVMGEQLHFVSDLPLEEHDTVWVGKKYISKGTIAELPGYASKNEFQWSGVSQPYNMPMNLQLPYDQNYLQFQFGQTNQGRYDSILYSYMLEGIDKNWGKVTDNNFTDNYLNLPPGDYTFKVSSKNMNGHWGKPAAFSFVISPPWWQTWWAYTFYVLTIGGGLWGFTYYRSQQLIKENRVLEEKIELRTNQLKQSIEDLKSTQTQLIQSEKMASLGELAAGIAHEIQNPLNFVNNFSDVNKELLLEMKDELDKGNHDAAKEVANNIIENEQKISHHGKRADAIVKGMLQHSRTGSGKKEPTDINALADEYLRLSYHGLRAKDKTFNATMKTDFDETIGKVNVVSQDMGRVILNLITNAFHVVTERKKLHQENYEPTVVVKTRKEGNKILISVNDNGSGIPQKLLDKIFQPFFTTKPAGQGTGLGLSISYDIVKVHGGELKVETREGEGTEFIIILPNS